MKKTIYLFALAALALPTANIQAQDSTAAPKADDGKLTISGYVDSYYLTAFNRPKSGNTMGYFANSPAAGGYSRAFDRMTNQFALGLVQAKFAYSNTKSDMVIDLAFGPNAELGNFGNHIGKGASSYDPANANQSTLYGTGAAIKQAYFTYKCTDKWNFTVGQFGTHIGYEVIDAPVNYNYSLSNLFNNGPFYHIGAKTSYAFSDKLGLMLGVVNNWDALTDWKSQKSIIAQVFVSPIKDWNIYLNYIGGYNDDPFKVASAQGSIKSSTDTTGLTKGTPAYLTSSQKTGLYTKTRGYTRQLVDLTTGYQVTDKFYVGLNVALGWYTWHIDKNKEEYAKNGTASGMIDTDGDKKDDKKNDPDANEKANVAYGNTAFGKQFFADSSKFQSWGGVALYANYKINDMFGVGMRYEHFDDRNGVRYLNGVNNSLTITAPITLADGHLLIKPEFRWDTGVLGRFGAKVNGSTTEAGLYETNDVQAAKAAGVNYLPTATAGQSTIGLAFIYKY